MSNFLKKFFLRERLKLSLVLLSFVFIILAAIPLSLYMLYNDLQVASNKQFEQMHQRVNIVHEEIEKAGSLDKVDSAFFDEIIFSGQEIAIDEGADEVVEIKRRLPSEDSELTQAVRFVLMFIVPFIQDNIAFPHPDEHAPIKNPYKINIYKDGFASFELKHMYKAGSKHYSITLQRSAVTNMSMPFNTFANNLVVMICWFSILTFIIVFFFLKWVFAPLEKAITTTFDKIDVESNTTKIEDPHYGPEVTKIVEVINKLLDKHNDLADSNYNTMQDVSHEVKTHLTAIKQNVDIIKRYGIEDRRMLMDKLLAIDSNIIRANDIVTTILDLARLKQGKRNITSEVFSVQFLIKKFMDYKQMRYPDFVLHSIIELGEEDVNICIERDHFILALNPILENAVKYSVDSNTILFAVKRGNNPNEICVSITNQGFSIGEEDIPYIFDRYYRGKNVGNVNNGSGLGLTITKEVMSIYNGDISVRSTELGKNTFTLTFPINCGSRH